MQQRSIFISRPLSNGSPIRELLESLDLHFQADSLIDFLAVDFELPKTKWLFFYSKTGVQYFFNRYPEITNGSYRIACFGPATSLCCQQYHHVDFHGNSDKETCLHLIKEQTDVSEITFICGKNSLRSVQSLSDHTFPEVIVYDNNIKRNFPLSNFDIAIVTSPMNYQAFIENGGTATEFIAIGPTTARRMKEAGVQHTIAETPSELSLATLLEERLLLKP